MPHAIEPELLRRPPRPVRPRTGAQMSNGMGCLRVFLLPFVLVGVVSIAIAFWQTGLVLLGTRTTGRIVSTRDTSGGDSNSYHARFSYSAGGVRYEGDSNVSAHSFYSLRPGQRVPVRYSALLPGRWPLLLADGPVPFNFGMTWLFTVVWNVFIGLFVWTAWGLPRRQQFLVRMGQPACALVTDRRIVSGEDSDTYYLLYRFQPETAGASGPVDGRDSVTKAAWDSVAEGDALTALHDPQRPKQCVLYRFAPYEVPPAP